MMYHLKTNWHCHVMLGFLGVGFMAWDSNKPTWDELDPKPLAPVMAGTIYVPSYQERPNDLIEYFVHWLFGDEQSRGPVKTLAPERSFTDCQDAIEDDSKIPLAELRQWHCTAYHQ
jgi:hypothetical protein